MPRTPADFRPRLSLGRGIQVENAAGNRVGGLTKLRALLPAGGEGAATTGEGPARAGKPKLEIVGGVVMMFRNLRDTVVRQ